MALGEHIWYLIITLICVIDFLYLHKFFGFSNTKFRACVRKRTHTQLIISVKLVQNHLHKKWWKYIELRCCNRKLILYLYFVPHFQWKHVCVKACDRNSISTVLFLINGGKMVHLPIHLWETNKFRISSRDVSLFATRWIDRIESRKRYNHLMNLFSDIFVSKRTKCARHTQKRQPTPHQINLL